MAYLLDESKSGLFFLHVPKTGGVALNAALENSFAARDCCVHIAPEDDERYQNPNDVGHRFVTGHVGPNLTRSVEPTHNRITVLRHPVERFLSHVIHDYRNRQDSADENTYADDDSVVAALEIGDSRFFQNSYLCHALAKTSDVNRWQIDATDLDRFGLVGLSHQQRKLLHLISYAYRTLPVVGNWKLNAATNKEAAAIMAARILPHMHYFNDDMATYRLAGARFAAAYRTMVENLFANACEPDMVTAEMIEHRLLARYLDRLAETAPAEAGEFCLDMSGSQPGPGWWWREHNHVLSYRWLGPEAESVAYLPPIRRRDYDLSLEVVAFASPKILENFSLWVGRHKIDHKHEVVSSDVHDVKYVIRGVVRANLLPPEGKPVVLRIVSPETLPVLSSHKVMHSASTAWYDTRLVSMALARLRLQPRRQHYTLPFAGELNANYISSQFSAG